MKFRNACLALVLALAISQSARADVPTEAPGRIEKLSPPFSSHWAWVADLVLERIALVDLDSGRFLGLVNGGYGPISPLFSMRRSEIYIPSTYFSRRTHGERTDVLEIYDTATLSSVGEVNLPPMRAIDAVSLGHSALSDDERFAVIFNWTPRTSLSVVNVEQRALVSQIDIPGCGLVYTAGTRRFLSLCADGSALTVTINDDGHEVGKQRSQPFFDPVKDPVTEKAVRFRDQWLFVSFEGYVHPIDVTQPEPRFAEPWSLLTDDDRKQSWRIGGLQHLAVHTATGRLFSLVHRGGKDTHKDPGEEVWTYDIDKHVRSQRIKLRSPGLTVYGFPLDPGSRWRWLSDWVLNTFVPAAVSHIQVTQDRTPLLFTASQFSGAVGVYDAVSGDFLRRVTPTGWTTDALFAPWTEP
ncbi:MAG TPA: amine dehydrogenase large subunit [Candidatus Binatia bacterium]|nr:amine dehydrogenase large subunit [Candidatus Binatia bacterium]